MEIHNRNAVVLGGPGGPVQSPLCDSDTAAWLQENKFPAVILVSSPCSVSLPATKPISPQVSEN